MNLDDPMGGGRQLLSMPWDLKMETRVLEVFLLVVNISTKGLPYI